MFGSNFYGKKTYPFVKKNKYDRMFLSALLLVNIDFFRCVGSTIC